jgi:hypothetical protein
MKRARRQAVWLLLGVAVLVALAVWQWRADRAAAPGTLLALDPQSVTHVELLMHGQAPQRFEKRDGHWWAMTPTPARTDDGRLDDIAAIAAAPVLRWRAAADFDMAKIGLDPPALVLQLNDRRIAYGAMAAFGPQRYVRVGDRIALIPAQYAPRSPEPAEVETSAVENPSIHPVTASPL